MSASFLAALGVPARCITQERRARENDRSFQLELSAAWQVHKVAVDGCWLTSVNQRKVDNLFYVTQERADGIPPTAVLVELKGGHLGHALTQIEETLLYLNQQPAWRSARTLRRLGFVVLSHGRQVPAYQDKVRKLAKVYNIKIRFQSRQMVITDREFNPQ